MDNTPEDAVTVLRSFWENTRHQVTADARTWSEQLKTIHRQGRGLEETLRYLYMERPSFDAFLAWINVDDPAEGMEVPVADVLSHTDISFFNANGYFVLRNAVSSDQCSNARQAILNYLFADPDDPSYWYATHEGQRGLMLTFYHHPALVANRSSGRIKRAFEQLYQSTAIHPVVDKVSFNPPETTSYRFQGSPLHWDVSLAPPIPLKLQGLLYLNDVDETGGAFHCVPGFHLRVEEWLQQLPAGVNPRDEAIRTLQPVPITGRAGDLIIWQQAVPHCATANRGLVPRFVQYITYDPDNYLAQEKWI